MIGDLGAGRGKGWGAEMGGLISTSVPGRMRTIPNQNQNQNQEREKEREKRGRVLSRSAF